MQIEQQQLSILSTIHGSVTVKVLTLELCFSAVDLTLIFHLLDNTNLYLRYKNLYPLLYFIFWGSQKCTLLKIEFLLTPCLASKRVDQRYPSMLIYGLFLLVSNRSNADHMVKQKILHTIYNNNY